MLDARSYSSPIVVTYRSTLLRPSQYVPFINVKRVLDVPVQRFHNEVHACRLFSGSGSFLIGVYSTESHPLGLVYEYIDNLDLKQYLTKEPNAEKMKLVVTLFLPSPY